MPRAALLWSLLLLVVSSGAMASDDRGIIDFGKIASPRSKGFFYDSFSYSVTSDTPASSEVGTHRTTARKSTQVSDFVVNLVQNTSAGAFFDACMKETEFDQVVLEHPLSKTSGLSMVKITLSKVKIVSVDLENIRSEEGQQVKLSLSWQQMTLAYYNVAMNKVVSEVKLNAQ